MGLFSGSATIYDLPNYVGELFNVSPAETPFLTMMGGLTGGTSSQSSTIQWQTVDNAAAAQPAILENAAPVNTERTRANVTNQLQIFQEGVSVGWSKESYTSNLSGASILGTQPVQNEMDFQLTLALERIARNAEYTCLQGAYQLPTDNTTARKTRGMIPAVTTNAVAAASARLSKTHLQALWKAMADSRARFSQLVVFANAFQIQQLTDIYAYAPQDRMIGGVAIKQILMDFGSVGIAWDPFMPTDTVLAAEMSVVKPRIAVHPTNGSFFLKEMGVTKSATEYQLYGELGLEYGPEQWHGKITGLATS